MTVSPTVSTQSGWRLQRESARVGGGVEFARSHNHRRVQDGTQSKVVREAVYGHIKALRKLGQTRVNTSDIALALNIPRSLVEQAVAQLEDKGVKIAK